MTYAVRALSFLWILLAAVVAATQQSPSAVEKKTSPATAQDELLIEKAKKTVVFLDTHYVDGKKINSWGGTGFFVYVADPRLPGRGVTWLVTNKHMLRPPERPYFDKVGVRFNLKEPLPDGTYVTNETVDVMDAAGNLKWVTSSDGSVDLALTIAIPGANVDSDTVPTDIFVTKDVFKSQRINENDDVLFTGLYAGYPGRKRNFPIVRHGKLALVTDERIPIDARDARKTEELVLAEITSFGGNSGSPVFVRLGGVREGGPPAFGYSYYLLGVMQGFFSENSDVLFDITASMRGTVSQNSGIAAVIPAQKILDVLASPRARAMADAIIANGLAQDGKYAEAEELYRRTITETELADGSYHPDLIGPLEAYGEMLKRIGRSKEAATFLSRARTISEESTKSPSTGQVVAITKTCFPDKECEGALTAKP